MIPVVGTPQKQRIFQRQRKEAERKCFIFFVENAQNILYKLSSNRKVMFYLLPQAGIELAGKQ